MDLAAALLEVGTGRAEASFALFAQTLDPQWIAQALQGKSLFVTLVLTSAQREADGWKIDARWGISWWADKDKVGGLFKVNPTLEETGLPTLTFDSPTPGLGPITLTVHGKTFMTGKTVGLALHPSAGGKGTIEIRLQRIEPGPAPDNMIKGVDGADMVLVPAGEFWMGSTQDEIQELIAFCRERNSPPCATDYNTRELPRHRVLLDAFYIDRFEVTNALFEQFVRATRHQTTAEHEGRGAVWGPVDGRMQRTLNEWRDLAFTGWSGDALAATDARYQRWNTTDIEFLSKLKDTLATRELDWLRQQASGCRESFRLREALK